MNRQIKDWYVVILTICLVSQANLRAQSVKYNYDVTGNRTSRSVVSTTAAPPSPAYSSTAINSMRELSVPVHAPDCKTDSTRYVKKEVNGEVFYEYLFDEVTPLPAGTTRGVQTEFFLPEPVLEENVMPFSVNAASFANLPGNVEIDRTKAVGEIPITSNFSNGAANYTIPIEIHPGRHNFHPNISLSYNSMSGNGVAGYGWTIGGLSAIMPVHSSFYYERTNARAEKLGVNADYALDGMRLIRRSAGNYETEQGFTKAVVQDSANKYYFDVTFPDGRKAVYGYKTTTTPQISYPLTSITDLAGNFVNYTYEKRNNGYILTEVNYGCNGNTIGKVKFNYKTRSDHVPFYIAGTAFKQDRLLSTIQVYHGDVLLRTYTLEHTINLYNFLSKVRCKAGTKELNPLAFYYGSRETPTSFFTKDSTQLYAFYTPGNVNILMQKYKPDNRVASEGLIAYPERNTYTITGNDNAGNYTYGSTYSTTQPLLIYKSLNGNLAHPTTITTGAGFQGLYPADINGDGNDELVKIGYTYNTLRSSSLLTLTTYDQQMRSTTASLELNGYVKENNLYSPPPRTFLTGNFTGDGRTTLLAVSGDLSYKGQSVNDRTNFTLIDLQHLGIISNKKTFAYDYYSDILFAMDFDGDGRTDLCHADKYGFYVYTFLNDEFTRIVTYTGLKAYDFRSNFYKILMGDINGDGKTDIIISPKFNSYTWGTVEKHIGTGAVCQGCCCCPENLVWEESNARFYECITGEYQQWEYCYIEDFPEKVYYNNAFDWKIYTSTGTSFNLSTVNLPFTNEDENVFVLHDVNGDQFPDMVVKSEGKISVYLNNNGTFSTTPSAARSVNNSATLIPAIASQTWPANNRMNQLLAIKDDVVSNLTFTRNDGYERKLTGVSNSLGVINKIEYAPMSEPYVYTANVTAAFPYSTIFMNDLLVSEVEVYHNNRQIEQTEFNYENATLHRQGFGFTGFRKITATDRIRSISTVTQYNPTLYGVVTSIENPASKTTFTYTHSVDNLKFVKLWMTGKTETDKLNNTTVTSVYQHDTYGNITNEEINYGSAEKVTITSLYNNTPRIGELYDQTVKTVRAGNESSQRTYITSFNTARQPLRVLQYTNGNQVMEVNNTYASGNLTKVVQKPYTSAQTLTSNFVYDNYGRLTKETDPQGTFITYSYTTKGELQSAKNHLNKQTVYAYDEFSRTVKTTYPDGVIETNSLSWVTAPAGAVYLMTVTATGKPTTRVYYDVFNREVRNGVISFDGVYKYTDSQYDTKGRLWKVSQPFRGAAATAWSTYTYDIYDRPLRVESPSGNIKTWAYSAGKVTTVTNGISEIHTFDAAGKTLTISGTAGTITYGIRADGQFSHVIAPGNIRTDYTYDAYGRITRETDPSFGATNYTYNAEGLLKTETDANNKVTEYTYDTYLRLKTKKVPEFTTTYSYNSDGLISGESSTNGTSSVFTYNDLFQATRIRQQIPDNKWLEKEMTYTNGNLTSVKYSSNLGNIATENMVYANGHLTERKLDNTTSFFKVTALNDIGQTTTTLTGGITRSYNYNSNGTLTGRMAKNSSTTFQNFSYGIDSTKGNLTSRKDNKYTKTENFEYDTMNRLKKYGSNTVTFDEKGNILTKSDAGTLSYTQSGKPYAVSGAANITSGIPQRSQTVTYTSFKRPNVITENNYSAAFTYGGSSDRVKMHLTKNSARELTRYYLGGCYEIDETGTSNIKEKLYLGGDYYSAPAVYVRENSGAWQLYYICRDHLGSITHITNSSGSTVTQELSYDAWGRLRNPSTQANYAPGAEPALFLGRGYTGHEHLPQFGLVNMNARLYDPVLGRLLAPDPYIQNPALSQNYNRYTYGMNNPLMYIDKDGEIVWYVPVIIGAVMGAYSGGRMANHGEANPFRWNYGKGATWSYMGAGAIVGGVSAYAGAAVAASGIPMANTAGIATSSFLNSVMTWGYTGGQGQVSVSFGVASYSFSNNTFNYLGKKGNKWNANMSYSFGALANLSDSFSLFRGGSETVLGNSAKADKEDWWSHYSVTKENGETLVSVGPVGRVQKEESLLQTWKNSIKEANTNYRSYWGEEGTWTLKLHNISTKAFESYSSGVTRWDLLFNSCVGHGSRALWSAGVPSLFAIHPHVLNTQLLMRQLGIYASPYLYQIPNY